MKTILDYFEHSVINYTDNIAVKDENETLTYTQLQSISKKIATCIAEKNISRKPIAIFLNRSVKTTCAMLSVLYSGNFYVVLDCDSPVERLEKIITTLSPAAILYDKEYKKTIEKICNDINIIDFEQAFNSEINEDLLKDIRKQMLSTDAAYSLFTSGSTGVPKGALLTHQNVISYIEWFVSCFEINQKTVFGSQTPLYFSMSVSDFYSSLFTGAQYTIIPKQYFAFPAKLIDYMNENKINTIYWVPSAMGMVTKFDLFKYCKPEFLQKVLFAGEVMPIKYLNYWKKYFPDLLYANLFGPTETTDICSYYIVNRDFKDDEALPIGIPCENCRLFLVDENGNDVTKSGKGEIYCSGPFIASGYYNNPTKTNESFVQNPLQNEYIEIVYKTGDLAQLNENGEFIYLGRKDFQIKHMGYRIELGEIESAFLSVVGLNMCVCLYNKDTDTLILAFEGKDSLTGTLRKKAIEKLPEYMQPQEYYSFDTLPINANGKTDRKELANKLFNN